MEEENKGFNLKVLISLIVGIISLIVIIPTISMIMDKTRPEEVKPEEYHFKFKTDIINETNGWTMFYESMGREFSTKTTTQTASNNFYTYFVDDIYTTIILYELEDNYYPSDFILGFNSTLSIQSAFYDYSNSQYGLYDFSDIIITESNQVLNPIYTPF